MQEPFWTTNLASLNPLPNASMLFWLTKPYILSQALKSHFGNIDVDVFSQKNDRIDISEHNLLERYSDNSLRNSCNSLYHSHTFLRDSQPPLPYSRLPLRHSREGGNPLTLFTRKVLLKHNNQILTHGRVVIPDATYHTHFESFQNLGQNLLGETFLYDNSEVKRCGFEYAVLNKEHFIFTDLIPYFTENITNLYARRSVFLINTYPLLVTEVFLPDLCS